MDLSPNGLKDEALKRAKAAASGVTGNQVQEAASEAGFGETAKTVMGGLSEAERQTRETTHGKAQRVMRGADAAVGDSDEAKAEQKLFASIEKLAGKKEEGGKGDGNPNHLSTEEIVALKEKLAEKGLLDALAKNGHIRFVEEKGKTVGMVFDNTAAIEIQNLAGDVSTFSKDNIALRKNRLADSTLGVHGVVDCDKGETPEGGHTCNIPAAPQVGKGKPAARRQ